MASQNIAVSIQALYSLILFLIIELSWIHFLKQSWALVFRSLLLETDHNYDRHSGLALCQAWRQILIF